MEIIQGLGAIPRSGRPLYLALGMFDGVHRGHQAVLARTREAAVAAGGRDLVLTFDPHPQRGIAPPPEPILLTTIEERLELFAARPMDGAVVVRFDDALRQTPAGQWLGGPGEGGLLFLGRPYAVRGRVVEGERRGRTLGFPTANLAVHPDKILPGRGIYAAWARLEGRNAPAAVSVGTRPTFGPGELLVEAFLLDFEGDLYGAEIELVFGNRLRDEQAFRRGPPFTPPPLPPIKARDPAGASEEHPVSLDRDKKSSILAAHRRHDGDTGSPEVQIALLTQRINQLSEHLKAQEGLSLPP